MPSDIHITASSVIVSRQIFKDGLPVFEGTDTDLPGFLLAAYKHLAIIYPKFYKMDSLAKLGWLGSEVLLKDSLKQGKYQPAEVGILFCNASSSLDADLKYFESTKDIASPSLFVYTLPNIVIGEICIKHKFKGESAFFIFEVFDAEFIWNYVSNLINSNILQACICGWVELIGEEYKAVLYLVEKNDLVNDVSDKPKPAGMDFTKENLNKIYYSKNG